MLFLLRFFTLTAAGILFGVAVYAGFIEGKYQKGLVMFASGLGFVISYLNQRLKNKQRNILPILIAAAVVGGVDWSEAAQLPASPFTLESPVTAPPTTPCSKNCKCGCQQGHECDCEEFKQSQIRSHLEREYNWLPQEKECREQRAAIDERISKLRACLEDLDARKEMVRPWHRGYEEMEAAREVALNCKSHEEYLWEIWNACDWVTWPREKYAAGCFGMEVPKMRQSWADRLRMLVGDVAYFSGNLPR